MATYSYYTRLTLVHPKDVNSLDITKGRIVAETATTGKFIISDLSWDSAVAPNHNTAIAYAIQGDLKILEPLGVRFLDYLRFAALEVGLDNHLDSRFFLEIEIVAETLPDNKKFRYIWPIMFLATEVKNTITEKGTEYTIKFIHTGHHPQTDMVQPIKEPVKIDGVKTVKEYFKDFGRKLELMEFKYAEAGQKAGKAGEPGGDHPAAKDVYHDEYHFIIDPRIENYHVSSKGESDGAIQGSWLNYLPLVQERFTVTAKTGTTLISQIQRVLASCKESSDLYLVNYGDTPGAGKNASQSSEANKKELQKVMGKIYSFFRVETHTVYKEFDYVRGRYAVKHIFIVYMALQPNLYQYPDELDELNKPENRGKVETKLKAYIQEGLLRKAYYYQYTGLNTEILKFNMALNQAYYLPSFPMVWTDRGVAGPGRMNSYNFNRNISPYARSKEDAATRREIIKNQNEAQKLAKQKREEKSESKRKELQKEIDKRNEAIEDLKSKTRTQNPDPVANTTITNRAEFLDSLKNLYIEDVDYHQGLTASEEYGAAHRPRMEPDEGVKRLDQKKSENEGLMEKIFTVQLGARDLVELDLDIRADPYWLGSPNMILSGKKNIEKLGLPPTVLEKINEELPKIDPSYNTRTNSWGDYDQAAKIYKGANLFYLNCQLPVNDFGEDDLMKFDQVDQIIGIYQVLTCKNDFKNGQWTQTLHCLRDLTIPSKYLPRASIGSTTWEDFVNAAIADPVRALDGTTSSTGATNSNGASTAGPFPANNASNTRASQDYPVNPSTSVPPRPTGRDNWKAQQVWDSKYASGWNPDGTSKKVK
jgi:hypothetical protein